MEQQTATTVAAQQMHEQQQSQQSSPGKSVAKMAAMAQQQEQQQQQEWNDPLQMLAKQCDTISGGGAANGAERNATGTAGNGKKREWTAAAKANGIHHQQNGTATATDGTGSSTLKSLNAQHQKGKASKSPNKPASLDPFGALSSPSSLAAAAAFHNGFMPPNPAAAAHLAALMGPFLPMMPPPPVGPIHPQQQQRPPFPSPFPGAFGPPVNGAQPFPGPAQINLMQHLMQAVQQQMPPPPMHLMPGMFPTAHQSALNGIPLPPSVPIAPRKQQQHQQPPPNEQQQSAINGFGQQHEQQAEAAAAAAAQLAAMAHMFPGGCPLPNPGTQIATPAFPPINQPNMQQTPNGLNPAQMNGNNMAANAQFLLQQPVQALLMAAACGQLPQFACPYKLKEGQPCGRMFATDDQLFAHYKSAHIAQMSSPTAVSSTTAECPTHSTSTTATTQQTPTTTANDGGGGKVRATANSKASPSSSRSTPTNQQQHHQQANTNSQSNAQTMPKTHSNPGPLFAAGWPMFPPGFALGMATHAAAANGAAMGAIGPQSFIGGGGGTGPAMNGLNGTGQQQQQQHNNNRFHPYLGGGGTGGQSQQPKGTRTPVGTMGMAAGQQQQPSLQQMAMALGLMSNGAAAFGVGMPGTATGTIPPYPTATTATGEFQQQQSAPQSQLAALAAMANSIGASNPAIGPMAPIGAGSG